jgi:hypothetical protein
VWVLAFCSNERIELKLDMGILPNWESMWLAVVQAHTVRLDRGAKNDSVLRANI